MVGWLVGLAIAGITIARIVVVNFTWCPLVVMTHNSLFTYFIAPLLLYVYNVQCVVYSVHNVQYVVYIMFSV